MTYDNDKNSDLNERLTLDDEPWVQSPGKAMGPGQPIGGELGPAPSELNLQPDGRMDIEAPQSPGSSLN